MRRMWKWEGDSRDELRIKVFCDESGSPKEGWIYFAILFVPEKIESSILQDLLNKRCDNKERIGNWGECNLQCQYHKGNNTEVHFEQVKRTKGMHRYFVASRWVDYFLEEVDKIFLYILGIDLNKLDKSYFGNEQIEDNIYNRFFRTVILKASKSFFAKRKYKKITITEIIHDKSRSKESHFYFNWHSIFFINLNDSRVNVASMKIKFLDSDHRKMEGHYSYSNFLQFTDLILGCTRNCLDYTSCDELKRKLSIKALDLIKRLIDKPGNINSSYRYVNRLKIDFFPKHDIRGMDENSLLYELRRWDSFYTKRDLSILHRKQGLLF